MKKFMFTLLINLLTLGVFAQTAVQPAGNGTEVSPYEIATWQNLYWISQNPSTWSISYHFTQTENIVFPSEINTWDNNKGWTPIGNVTFRFSGKYNGNNKTISGLFINRPANSNQGLFGYTNQGSEIRNLGLTEVNITADSFTGSIAGRNKNIISDCYSIGSVTALNGYCGAITGENDGTVSHCYSNVTVIGHSNIGGISGANNGTISDCFSASNVTVSGSGPTAGYYCGGITGTNGNSTGATIIRCFSSGETCGIASVGGIAGYNDISSTISESYCTGEVRGNDTVGGLIGYNYAGIFSNCYSQSNVVRMSGTNSNFGGFIGRHRAGTISYSYSTGSVTYTGTTNPANKGFAGTVNSGSFIDCYWDKETSGQTSSSGEGSNLTGKTTVQMKQQATFTNWNFTAIWTISENTTYPFLIWQQPEVTELNTPQNVHIIISGNDVLISWDEVENATSYKVYSSANPDENFEEEQTGQLNGTNWSSQLSDTKKFYYIKAISE